MNSDILSGMWKQLEGSVKQQWGKLTDNDLKQIDGSREKLVGKLEERYGYSKDQAEAQVDQFLSRHGTSRDTDFSH